MSKSKALAMMVGASAHSETEREHHDYYATDPIALKLLMEHQPISNKVWEPACGEGHLAKVLHQAKPYSKFGNIRSTDLVDRGYGEVLDFFSVTEPWEGDIITNPPFKNVDKFIRHGLSLLTENNRLIIFCRLHLLESVKRYKLFQEFPLKNGLDTFWSRRNRHEWGLRQVQSQGDVLWVVCVGEWLQGRYNP